VNEREDFKFDQKAAGYDDGYDDGYEGKLSEKFYSNLVEQVELGENANVLDIGCGTGTVLFRLNRKAPIHGHGIDIENEMLKQAQKKLPDMDIQNSSCSALPYPDHSMDVIVTCMAYHHFDKKVEFRAEVKRVLKPDGVLYICDPRFPWIIRKFFDIYASVHRLNAKFYRNKALICIFEEDGFKLYKNLKDWYVQVIAFKMHA
jgi:Methylase involved in ubiquinone/menaquinone biosynthesis